MVKVALIGLDGATFDVIMPLVNQGKLPVLKRLIDNGAHAKLFSTVPAMTPPAWVSAFTGNNPGKHGILDFFRAEWTNMRPVNSTDIRSATLWELLNEHNRRTIVINVPMTYPPRQLDGAMVSGMFVPSEESEYTYPQQLKDEIRDVGFRIERQDYHLAYFSDKDRLVKEISHMTEQTCNTCLHLMRRVRWDFLMVVFTAPDRAQHFYWKHMDPSHPRYDTRNSRKYGAVISDTYENLDRMLGRLLDNFDEDTLVIVMSDHGFGPVHTDLYVNRLLMQLNLLTPGPQNLRVLAQESVQRLAVRLLEKQPLRSFADSPIAHWIGRRLFGSGSLSVGAPYRWLDFEGTKAFFPSRSGQYIRINLKTREPSGIVEPGKPYEDLRDHLINELLNLRDPRTGTEIIENVFRREEVYRGPETEAAPDLLLVPRRGYAFQAELGQGELLMPSREVISDVSGGHRPEGILIITGPHVRSGVSLAGANIVDVAATVLYAAGLPIPNDMDGRLLSEIFDPAYVTSNRPTYSEHPTAAKVSGMPYSSEEEQEIIDRLRALGYV